MRGLRCHLGLVSHVLAGVFPLVWYAVLTRVQPYLGLLLLYVVVALLPDLASAAGRVVEVRIVSVVGNEATVEIVVEVPD
jgi:hypothetical protein